MTTEQQQVQKWMLIFGQETPLKPIIPSFEVRKLRAKLILEEALEAIIALGIRSVYNNYGCIVDLEELLRELKEPDIFLQIDKNPADITLANIADQLADLHYVAYCGTAVACGLDMEQLFQIVHASNMSKFWAFHEVEELKDKTNLTITETKDHYFIVKDKTGKVIKSPSFKNPENMLAAEIDRQLKG